MNSTEVKKVSFLRHDVNQHHNYEMIKSGKTVLNLSKDLIYNQHHSSIHDFTLNPKNNYSEYPFNGSSSFYVDFELPKLNYCYNSFVLRFKLQTNDTVNSFYILPAPFLIDRLVLLKNSNVLSEVSNEEIMLYNLHKISNKTETNYSDFDYSCLVGLTNDTNNKFIAAYFSPSVLYNDYNMELPLCLTNSNFLSSAIKNDLVVRIYFKGNIITSDFGLNSSIKLADLKLMLRVKESSQALYKEPKFNYLFMKKVLTKINIPSLENGNTYNLNITGFNSVASYALLYIRDLESSITFSLFGHYHRYKYNIDDVSVCDNTGKNIFQSDLILLKDYNRYLLSSNLGLFGLLLNTKLTDSYNDGNIYLLNFSHDANANFNHGFSGGYSFKNSTDYKLKFKSLSSVNRSVVMNILWFSPSMLELESGDLKEFHSSE